MDPLAKIDPHMLIVDGALHGFIDQNPPETALKFIEHNLLKLRRIHAQPKGGAVIDRIFALEIRLERHRSEEANKKTDGMTRCSGLCGDLIQFLAPLVGW